MQTPNATNHTQLLHPTLTPNVYTHTHAHIHGNALLSVVTFLHGHGQLHWHGHITSASLYST